MCRRFRRLTRLANQVVEVTRSFWRVCKCCGAVNEETRRDIVPLSAVINGTLSTRPVTSIPEDSACGHCCFVQLRKYISDRSGKTETCISMEQLLRIESSDVSTPAQLSSPKPSTSGNTGTRREGLPLPRIGSLETVQDGRSESGTLPAAERVHSDRTPDSSHPPIPSQQNSDTSQTDDKILTRFYGRLSPIPVSISPEQEKRSDGILSSRHFPTNESGVKRSVCFNPLVRLRLFITEGLTGQYSHTSTTEQTPIPNPHLSMRFPISDIVCPPVTRPTDLKVEFAAQEIWNSIYPVQWSIQQNITKSTTSSVDLVMLGNHNKQIALKTLGTSDSQLESQLLIECQSSYVVNLCACLVQGDRRYLCMSYYERRDLAMWLKKDVKRQYFKEREGIYICAYVLSSIQYLHQKNILHLDINPSNILIDDKGYPVLADFSKARRSQVMQSYHEDVCLTPDIQAENTPDRLDDLWSVACVLYEIVTHSKPYRVNYSYENTETFAQEDIPDVSTLTPDARHYVISQLTPSKKNRLGFVNGCREVMHHVVFRHVDWDEVNFSHRENTCRLNKVFKKIEHAEWLARNKWIPNPFHKTKTTQNQVEAPASVAASNRGPSVPGMGHETACSTDSDSKPSSAKVKGESSKLATTVPQDILPSVADVTEKG